VQRGLGQGHILKIQSFGQWLKELRGEQTQSEYAHKLGIDQSYLGRLERDERPPNEILCIQIARAEHLPLDSVLMRAGFEPVGEGTQVSNEELEHIRLSLSRITSAEVRARAILAATAVIDSLADTEQKQPTRHK
jgi:transcriptional regulator with XRE-family HTH domain